MKRVLSLTFAGLCVVAAIIAGSGKAIVGGQIDGSRHPSVGFLIGINQQGRPFYGCSGTLVAPTLFVTAAHCTGGLPGVVPSEVRVVFASQVSFTPTLYITGTPHPNPRYVVEDVNAQPTFEQRSEDYGVVVLDRPASDVFSTVTTSPLTSLDLVKKTINKKSYEIVGFGVSWLGHIKALTFDGYRRYAIADANGNSLIDPSVLEVRANPNGSDETDGLAGGGDSGGAVFDDGTLIAVIGGIDAGGKTLAARLDTPNAREFLSQF